MSKKTEQIKSIGNEIFDYLINYAPVVLNKNYTYEYSVLPKLVIDTEVSVSIEDKYVDVRNKDNVMDYRQELLDTINELVYYVGINGLVALRDCIMNPDNFIQSMSNVRFNGLKFKYPSKISLLTRAELFVDAY